MLAGLHPLRYLDYVGTERVLMDRTLHKAEEIRVARTKDFAKAIAGELAVRLAKMFR